MKFFKKQIFVALLKIVTIWVLFLNLSIYPLKGWAENRYTIKDSNYCIPTLVRQKVNSTKACLSADELEEFMTVFLKECTLPESFTPKVRSLPLIPQILAGFLPGISREQYINALVTDINWAKIGSTITEDNIKQKVDEKLQYQKKEQLLEWNFFDVNKDGNVTPDEMASLLIGGKCFTNGVENSREFCDENAKKNIQDRMKADANGDNIITQAEMAAIPHDLEQATSNTLDSMRAYLALDPNHDGKMTIDELKSVSNQAFSLLDADNNDIISLEEQQNFSASQYDNGNRWKEEYPTSLPIPTKEEKEIKKFFESQYNENNGHWKEKRMETLFPSQENK
jgi:Ca2+-binding EF-hand superfamily protein